MRIEVRKVTQLPIFFPRRSKRLQKTFERKQTMTALAETPPQVAISSQGPSEKDSKDEGKQKKRSKKPTPKQIAKAIDDYRHRIMEKANQECLDYRAALAEEEKAKKTSTISFNRKKEVLEFCKNVWRQRKSKPPVSEPELKQYEIKSVLKGSNEVYTGNVTSKRNSILGQYHINEETVQELQSCEISNHKAEEIVPPPPPDKKSTKSPKSSPKSSNSKKQ